MSGGGGVQPQAHEQCNHRSDARMAVRWYRSIANRTFAKAPPVASGARLFAGAPITAATPSPPPTHTYMTAPTVRNSPPTHVQVMLLPLGTLNGTAVRTLA